MAPTADNDKSNDTDSRSHSFASEIEGPEQAQVASENITWRNPVKKIGKWLSAFRYAFQAANNNTQSQPGQRIWVLRDEWDKLHKDNKKLREERDEAVKLSMTDSLTGLPNRAGFEFGMRKAVGSMLRNHGKPSHTQESIVLASIDADELKHVNDTAGHQAGDKYLSTLAMRLIQTTRKSDYVARFGGDEFAIGMVTDDAQLAQNHMRGIQKSLDNERTLNPSKNVPIISMGFAVLTHSKIDEILEDARKQSGFEEVNVRDLDVAVDILYSTILGESDADMYRNKAVRRAAKAALARNAQTGPQAPAA